MYNLAEESANDQIARAGLPHAAFSESLSHMPRRGRHRAAEHATMWLDGQKLHGR